MTENTALTRVSIYTTSRIELESDDFFDHFTGLRWIYIKYLLSREPPSFKKLLSLQHLYLGLVGSNTHTFDDTIVNGLSNLYSLTLYSSYFNRITKGAFGNLNRLYILSIANSKITYIEDGVFTDLPSLQTLYLDNTELSNISNNIFEGLSRLTYLSVSQNPGFPISVLLQTRNLVRIDLNYNEYQTLDPYVFQQMKQLTDLGLSDPFLCDCNLQWISVIKQFGISIGAGQSPFCFQPFKFQQTHIYDTSVYSNCSQSQTYQCFNKSITCPSNLVCHNTNISYTCGCPIGYELNVSGNCIDVNECDKETSCQHTCVNTEGSFYCICDKGYKQASNGYQCDDINECHEWNGGCEHGCGNTIGSYQCYCQEGHQLYNQTHCETNIECDVINHRNCLDNSFVCQGGFNVTVTNLTCDSHVPIPATSATGCPIGFLQRSSGECVDEDECDQGTKCEHTCVNTEGSFYCMCSQGYQLASNQHNCSDVNECQEWNGGCEYGCGNTIGSYHCYCENGHSLKNETHCETDIKCEAIDHRDCLDNTFVCQGGFNITVTNLTCHPHVEPTTEIIPVTSATGCPIGYVQWSTGECVDKDECDQETKCEHACVNTEGSFYCMCPQGYQLASNQHNCSDINECQKWNGGCEYGCGNTIGSYQCYCENGHSLMNETHCNDRIECELIEIITTDMQECSYICKGGYNLTVSGLSCPNVNSQQNTLPNETTHHTSEPNLSTVQSESSLMIPLVLLMGISLITNLVFIVLIIAVFIYFLRKKNGNSKHRIPEIHANPHHINELALPEIPNEASFITSRFNNQDTQKYPLTMNEENGDYANMK